MAQDTVYIGARLDLDLLAGDDVIDYQITVLDSNSANYGFTGISDINVYVYDFDGKDNTLLKTIPDGSGVGQSGAIVTMNWDYSFLFASIFNARRSYYYRCTYLDANSKPITVFYGYLNT